MPQSASELGQKLIDIGQEILKLAEDGEDIPEGKWENEASDEIWSAIDYLSDKRAMERSISDVSLSKRTETEGNTTYEYLDIIITNGRGDTFEDEVVIGTTTSDG